MRGTVDTNKIKGTPRISVIVPCYNIEDYIINCLNSLVIQSFTDYEIICIDDGSSDATGLILDDYASRYSKIRVIHQDNEGLSNARNVGVSASTGCYLSFVDGDDVVSPYYLEALNSDALSGNCLVVSQPLIINGGTTNIAWSEPDEVQRIEKEEIIESYMYETILPGAWGRLASKEIYERCPFPKGMYYEEIATAARYVELADKIYYCKTPIYGYVMRQGSIVHRKIAQYEQVLDYKCAIRTFLSTVEHMNCEKSASIDYFVALHLSRVYRLCAAVDSRSTEVHMEQKRIVQSIRKMLIGILNDKSAPSRNKMRFIILAIMPSTYSTLFEVYSKLIKK